MKHTFARVLRVRRFSAPLMALLLVLAGSASAARAQGWTLSNAQRQAYLYYYAPILLNRSDGNNGKQGRDWITNYDFDRDGDFSNNRVNWNNINQYVNAARVNSGAYSNWRIRPTLYTALIEYMEGSTKNLVMLYHVYHGSDKDGKEIHDWERIEIVVRNVLGAPGGNGEYLSHATVTSHGEHIMRQNYYGSGLNFLTTATGNHLMLWQADESDVDIISTNPFNAHAHEIHYVKDLASNILYQSNINGKAEINISNASSKKNVHYVFVPEGSASAVSAWRAQQLNYSNAASLASPYDNGNTVRWTNVPRITYELQDLADVYPTHWQGANWSRNWLANEFADVLLESPITNEASQAEVSAGLQRFYTVSRDSSRSNLTDGRDGIAGKKWFYGVYSGEFNYDSALQVLGNDKFKGYEGLGLDTYGRSRGQASGYLNSHNAFWWQHDFFVHSGVVNSADTREEGVWLSGAWHTAANGGFDGRWTQLFDDRTATEPVAPLRLNLDYGYLCATEFYVTATAVGGRAPYTFTWTNATPLSGPNDQANVAVVYAYNTATVQAQSADGQSYTQNIYLVPDCGGGIIP
jgi:hypothetical protein